MSLSSRFRLWFAVALTVSLPSCLPAQNGAARGAAVITDSLLARHVFVIADDSMLGRDTPSRGLDLTARYIAANFQRLGLKPGGDDGTYLQHYPIVERRLDGSRSSLHLQVGATTATASFARDVRHVYGAWGARPIEGPAVLVGGDLKQESIDTLDLTRRVVLLVGDFTKPLQSLNVALNALVARNPSAIVLISNRDANRFEQLVRSQFRSETSVLADEPTEPVAVEVRDATVAPVLNAAGIDVATVRAAETPVIRPLPTLAVKLSLADERLSEAKAPNTVGILEGTDPQLRNEYIVLSAHMDHVGVNSSNAADSIWNGADDDASGTTGVLALAEAFAAAPTKRSIIFVTVSGEEKGLWGSEWFASHPPVPVERMVANINLDMIGRNWKDTIVAIGKEHSDLGATLATVTAAHPELNMQAIDDIWPQENFYFRSDHYNFAKRGVPILFFFNGTHEDYHQPSDAPEKIDTEKMSRVVKLIYYLGQEIGNAAEKPKWKPESYRRIVGK